MAGRNNSSLEDDIIGSIEDATGEDLSGTDVNTEVDDQEEIVEDQQQQRRDDAPDDDDNQPDLFSQKSKDKKEQQQRPKKDAKGNIVDEKGQIIANRGAERRLHTQNERLKSVNTDLQSQLAEAHRQIAANKAFNGLPEKLGIGDPQVLQEGLGIVALFNSNPMAGARKVIELALARGVDLKQLVDDEFVANVSTRSVAHLLDERLGPIEQRTKQENELAQANETARRQAESFLADYPEAEPHSEDIANIMRDERTKAKQSGRPFDAYAEAKNALLRIQNFAIQNGLNPDEPLAPQIEARKADQEQKGNRSQNGQRRPTDAHQRQSRPMPRSGGTPDGVVETRSRSARPDDSFDTIIRDSMREAGYDFGR